MSLTPAEADKLAVGKPAPWTLYDQDRNVLLEHGQLIETEGQRQSLIAKRPLREISWEASGGNIVSGPANAQSTELDESLAKGAESRFTFADMRLRVGDRIQLQPPASMGTDRFIVRLIGFFENASLLVTAPAFNGMRLPLREEDKIVARVFSTQRAFGFDCYVVRVCKLPYSYLHLSWPEVIQGAVVRKSPRIKTRIIASIAKPDAGDKAEKLSGVIVDLSADGALVKSRQALGEKSQEISLSFRVNLHNMEAYVTTKAIIRNVFTDEDNEKEDPLRFHHGIQFVDVPQNDKMILQSLIYQQMIEQPHTLA
ncbi:MAG: flagellar brake protein [Burkholderiales bacterium]|nr:flagellar brake protein [Burkholderiales bacterium]